MLRSSEKTLFRRVGKRLVALRKEKGFSQTRLAAESGLSAGHIGQIEQGRRHPTLLTLQRLCRGLEIDLKDFFQKL